MKYIDADKLTTIIEERKAQQDQWINSYHDPINQGISHELTEILSIITSLQQEEDKDSKEAASQYRDIIIKRIEEKRVLPSFKGQLLHDFKNELNTMEQILGIRNWSDIQYALFEKFALVFATWGGYHFHPKETESEDSLQQEQPDGLDDAAEDCCLGITNDEVYKNCKIAFKAGAEWMAGQGVTVKGLQYGGNLGIPDIPEEFYTDKQEEVIVQIRKK